MRRAHAPSCFAVALAGYVGVSFCAFAAGQDQKNAHQDALKAVAHGYLSNREAFEFLTCKFRVEVGSAPTLEQAQKGMLDDVFVAHGVWICNGEKTRFELNCSPHAFDETVKKQTARQTAGARGQTSIDIDLPFAPNKILDSGKYQVHYAPMLRVASVAAEDQRGQVITLTPWDMGVMGLGESNNPAKCILESLDRCVMEHMLFKDGVELLPVKVRGERKGKDCSYFFDPNRGYLPRQIWFGDTDKTHITEVRECSRGRWFPLCSRKIWSEGAFFNVRQITVVELDVDKPPTDDQFEIEIPEKTYVNDNWTKGSQFALEGPARIRVNDLPGLYQKTMAHASNYLRQQGSPAHWSWILISVPAAISALWLCSRIRVLVQRRLARR